MNREIVCAYCYCVFSRNPTADVSGWRIVYGRDLACPNCARIVERVLLARDLQALDPLKVENGYTSQ